MSCPWNLPTWRLTSSTSPLGRSVQATVMSYRIQYLIVDKLMYRETSALGFIYSLAEPHAFDEKALPESAYRNLLKTGWMKLTYSNSQMAIFRLSPR